eukprot:623225-Hanusia_phi.AAC.1
MTIQRGGGDPCGRTWGGFPMRGYIRENRVPDKGYFKKRNGGSWVARDARLHNHVTSRTVARSAGQGP